MTRHALLDNVTHKHLRVIPGYRPGQGFEVNAARVFPSEFGQLQAEYPIVFNQDADKGQFQPLALLGLADRENLYLTPEGWDARYVPLSIRRQPFLIGFRQSTDDGVPRRDPVVHIDLDHPKVSETEGEPVFLEHGGESPLLERTTVMLQAIHEGHQANETLARLLVGLDLLESFTLNFALADGSTQDIGGLYTINEERLRGLNADALDSLHRAGHLQSVYMVLASLPNLARLIERKNRALEAAADD